MYTPRIARGVQPGRLRRTPFMNPLSSGGVSIEVSIPSSVIFFLDKNSDPRLVGGGASPVSLSVSRSREEGSELGEALSAEFGFK
jgi:hypothetical protein